MAGEVLVVFSPAWAYSPIVCFQVAEKVVNTRVVNAWSAKSSKTSERSSLFCITSNRERTLFLVFEVFFYQHKNKVIIKKGEDWIEFDERNECKFNLIEKERGSCTVEETPTSRARPVPLRGDGG